MTGRFKKGHSGNPAGRKPGTSKAAPLRAAIAAAVPEIVNTLIAAARGGDVGASRLLLERAIPALRPVELPAPVALDVPSTLADQGRALLEAAASGAIAPSQAAAMLDALGSVAKLQESTDILRRLEALEQRQGVTGGKS
jgi:hypothetical protein